MYHVLVIEDELLIAEYVGGLVYAAADYRFSDFVKIGMPMNVTVGLATCLAIAWLIA